MKRLTRKLTVKCTPAWLAEVEALARGTGMSRSEVVRRSVEGARLSEPADSGYRDLAYQLAKLGTLYNQTVKLAHQTKYRTGEIPAAELIREVRSHAATLDVILQAVLAQDPRQNR